METECESRALDGGAWRPFEWINEPENNRCRYAAIRSNNYQLRLLHSNRNGASVLGLSHPPPTRQTG